MRFMVLVKASKDSEAGVLPDETLLTEMTRYNEELVKAGVLLAAEGLQPSSKGARVKFSGDKRTVIDGPFAETKELIAGYWLFQVKSLEECIEWVKRCPNPMPGTESEIEIRQVFDADDFGPQFTSELREAETRLERKTEEIGREIEAQQDAGDPELDAVIDEDIGDDLLRLVFIACHPVLTTDARVALTLRLLGGLTTDEIARAFLVSEPTVAQRIVRAKRTLTEARVPFEVPRGADLAARLSSVLEVIYLIFNEGYSATAGDDWMRPGLCEDALRLGRILAGLMPGEAEVHGLVALLELQASRAHARTGPDGEPVLLLEQNRALWGQGLIRR